jgi:hypothetical protein
MPIARGRKFTIRVTDEELSMLEALANADGVTSSDYVRQFVRREHAARFETVQRPRVRR